ncbi:MAG TPA: nucleotide-binding protein [Thermoanaerobaculia bacterium]|nr:nucleotide-binding protein [Thermoanaerobaculia bacterium]
MRALTAFLVLVVTSGCAKNAAESAAAKPETKVPAAPAAASAQVSNVAPVAPQPELVSVTGKVLETMDASDYTYMRLKTAGGETWAAVNKTKVAKGDTVTVVNAMSMDGFQSRTLNRTFDRIVFGVLAPAGAAAPAAGAATASLPMVSDHPPTAGTTGGETPQQMAAQHGQAASGPADAPDVKVPKAEGANAKTVAELWAERTALKGKDVVVRARVVKVNAGVMGRNWIHVRDGSGSKAAKNNDLTVTTDALAKVGDIVTVSGTVSIDKDFGAGYAYPVILENAKLN